MWVKIDDRFFHNPKIRRAGKDGRELYLAGLTYVNAQLTDGFIHRDDITYIASWAEVMAIQETTARLVELQLWEPVKDGYVIHDYHDYNPTREELVAIKAARAKAGRIGGQRSGESRREAKDEANPEATDIAKLNPVPVPVPVPEPEPFPVPEPKYIAQAPISAIAETIGREELVDFEVATAIRLGQAATAIKPVGNGRSPPLSEGQKLYLEKFARKRFGTADQKNAIGDLERDVGPEIFLKALTWAAENNISKVGSIRTAAKKMQSNKEATNATHNRERDGPNKAKPGKYAGIGAVFRNTD